MNQIAFKTYAQLVNYFTILALSVLVLTNVLAWANVVNCFTTLLIISLFINLFFKNLPTIEDRNAYTVGLILCYVSFTAYFQAIPDFNRALAFCLALLLALCGGFIYYKMVYSTWKILPRVDKKGL